MFPNNTRMAVVHVLPSRIDWREGKPLTGLSFLHDSLSTRAAAAWDNH
jgi:hypothetical protein